MSSTIVRVKRRLEESPLEAVVLHCKRPRTENQDQLSPSVFIFSGTVKESDNAQKIKKSWLKDQHSKANLLDASKASNKTLKDLVNKLKEEHKTAAQDKRIKIINYSRGLSLCCEDVPEDVDGSIDDKYAVLDLHHSKEDSEEMNSTPAEGEYAYDLYLSQQKDFDVTMLDDIVRIDPYQGELVFGSYRDNGLKAESDNETEDDEDSNDENNERNEYPDTDDSINEEDMRKAMNNCDLEETLSSDDGEEEMVYGASASKGKSVYQEDVDRYGLSYAKYKAKLFKSKNPQIDGEPSLIDSYGAEDVLEHKTDGEDSDNDCAKSYDGESGSGDDEY